MILGPSYIEIIIVSLGSLVLLVRVAHGKKKGRSKTTRFQKRMALLRTNPGRLGFSRKVAGCTSTPSFLLLSGA